MEESGGDAPTEEGEVAKASATLKRGQRRGIISRVWRGIFGARSEDYEKKLEHLSKEEAAVHAKMKRRDQSSRKRARNLIMLSVTFEVRSHYLVLAASSFFFFWIYEMNLSEGFDLRTLLQLAES